MVKITGTIRRWIPPPKTMRRNIFRGDNNVRFWLVYIFYSIDFLKQINSALSFVIMKNIIFKI